MIFRNPVISIAVIMFSFSAVFAQENSVKLEKGVQPHPGIDAIYANFSKAYRNLDVGLVSSLYSDDAAYLQPDSEILFGRTAISPSFGGFFDWIRKEGKTMEISFQIFQRRAEKNIAYDVGIYTIRQFKEGKESGGGSGKFVVVAIRGKDKKWRFQVDGYSSLKAEKP